MSRSKEELKFIILFGEGRYHFECVIISDNHWSFSTTLQQSHNICSGKLLIFHTQKCFVSPNQELKLCCCRLHFGKSKELFTMDTNWTHNKLGLPYGNVERLSNVVGWNNLNFLPTTLGSYIMKCTWSQYNL